MKNLISFNPYRMNKIPPYAMLESMEERLSTASRVLDKLREKECMSSKQLDNAVTEILGESGFTIRPYLDALESMGFIRTEIRSEEYLEVQMACEDEGKTYPTHDPNCVIFVPRTCYNKLPKPYLIYNPVISRIGGGMEWVKGKRMIQVRRKYYHWVG